MQLINQEFIKLINQSDLIKSYCGISKDWKNICHIGHNTIHQDLGNGQKRGVFYGKRKYKDCLTTNMLINFAHEGVFKHLEKKYGKEAVWQEFYEKSYFKPALLKFGSGSFKPDANPESTSVDGTTYFNSANDTWANVSGGAGTGAYDDFTYLRQRIDSGTTSDRWDYMDKIIVLFDTSSIGAGATVDIASLTLIYNSTKTNSFTSGQSWAFNVYSSAPSSNTSLAAGDYDSLGSTAFCDTAVTYANWDGTEVWNFNASGLAAVTVDGITKLGIRESTYEATGTPPTWDSAKDMRVEAYSADNGSNEPTLDVTWTPSGWSGGTLSGAASIASVDTVAIANIGSINSVT